MDVQVSDRCKLNVTSAKVLLHATDIKYWKVIWKAAMKLRKPNSKAWVGQGSSEYTVLAVGISVVAVATLALLGGNVASLFQDLLGDTEKRTPETIQALANTGKAFQATNSAGYDTPRTTIRLSDGTVLNFEPLPAKLSETVMTIGVNGSTEKLIATLRSLAITLGESGKITPEQQNLLFQMANKGHTLAEAEKAIENIALSATSSADFKATPVTIGEKQYASPIEAALEIGVDGDNNRGSILQDFDNLYQQLKQSQALKDPAVQQLVSAIHKDIYNLADSTEGTVWSISQGEVSPDKLQENTASTVTHSKSSILCEAGDSRDSGIRCTD